jgi:hypothetical protein
VTKAKTKALVYKCPACGEVYDSADVVCVGRPESGHPNEPTPVETVEAVEAGAEPDGDAAE